MKCLNLGCGYHYSNKPEWTNVDFKSTGTGVLAHNLLLGVPFEDDYYDLVYHSHVLEHFSRDDGLHFLMECIRVLKPGGTMRIAVPDLEGIIRNYIRILELGIEKPEDPSIRADYEWIMLELFDQAVRNSPGGAMGRYLSAKWVINEEFVFSRIGEEGRAFRKMIGSHDVREKPVLAATWRGGLKTRMRAILLKILGLTQEQADIGRFRTSGEIHQWMYDRYSLRQLIVQAGGQDIQIRDAFSSNLAGWSAYNLDAIQGVVRKPDSLFVEAIKPFRRI